MSKSKHRSIISVKIMNLIADGFSQLVRWIFPAVRDPIEDAMELKESSNFDFETFFNEECETFFNEDFENFFIEEAFRNLRLEFLD